MNPKYPIYIVSKGRWETRKTSKCLEAMKCPYYIIVDEKEYHQYANVIDHNRILIQPQKYYDEYDMFWKDGNKVTGPGAARNYAWDHSIETGFDWHWVLDDNIAWFMRLWQNTRKCVTGATIFKCMEDFVLRYENVAIAGPNYIYFANARSHMPPFITNTRIYSCLFIRNNIPYRWRGRYNEDTDLCLRALKDGWCTIQFYAFLQDKKSTQLMTGGNTDQFYSVEGTYNKSKMLKEMHPDVTQLVWRWGRQHHYVDYTPFKKNKLIRKEDIVIPKGINNYGMKLVDIGHKI